MLYKKNCTKQIFKISTHRRKICIVATVPFAVNVFLAPQIKMLCDSYDVTIMANGVASDLLPSLTGIQFIPLKIERKISIGRDLLTLFKLCGFFHSQKFDVVHSITPKAGLLAMLAAKLTGIEFRIHNFTGQIWANKIGLKRMLLRFFDELLAYCATRVLADSNSQRSFLINNKVVNSSHIVVLAEGSAAGVDLNRFKADDSRRDEIRARFNIDDDAVIFLFVGRLTYDKGLLDLSKAFADLASTNLSVHLMIVGSDEESLTKEIISLTAKYADRIHIAGYSNTPEYYMAGADVLCLPSYREGFGAVIIEAAAAGLPAIASRIYGVTDAVEEGVTGLLHPPGAIDEILRVMALLASDIRLIKLMGQAARSRAEEKFSQNRVVLAYSEFYKSLFNN